MAVCVLMSSALAPVTVMISATFPTSSAALMVVGTPNWTRTSVMTAVLNPASDTVTVYVPADNAGTENVPVVLVTTSNVVSVALLLTTTLAPGMTPPALSVTTPEMADVAPPCAWALAAPSQATSAIDSSRFTMSGIHLLPFINCG